MLHTAETPWKPVHLLEYSLMNPQGETIYKTKYAVLQNLALQFMPYQYLFTGKQQFGRYAILDHEEKETGAFFAIYYDFKYHNNTAKMHRGYKVVYKKNFHKNIDKYDPDFIRRNFGENELQRMETFFKESVKKTSTLNLKVFWIIWGALMGACSNRCLGYSDSGRVISAKVFLYFAGVSPYFLKKALVK